MSKNKLLIAAVLGVIYLTISSVYSMEEKPKTEEHSEGYSGFVFIINQSTDEDLDHRELLKKSRGELIIDTEQLDSEFEALLELQNFRIKESLSLPEDEKERTAQLEKFVQLTKKYSEYKNAPDHIQQELSLKKALLASLDGVVGEDAKQQRRELKAQIDEFNKELRSLSKTNQEEILENASFLSLVNYRIFFESTVVPKIYNGSQDNIKLFMQEFIENKDLWKRFMSFFKFTREKETDPSTSICTTTPAK